MHLVLVKERSNDSDQIRMLGSKPTCILWHAPFKSFQKLSIFFSPFLCSLSAALAMKRNERKINLSQVRGLVTSISSICNYVSDVPADEILDVQVPDSVPVDLRAKLIVCLIQLNVFTPSEVKTSHHFVPVHSLETISPTLQVGCFYRA